jgi:hypothetical protein
MWHIRGAVLAGGKAWQLAATVFKGSSRVLVGGSGLEIEPAAMEKDAHAVVGK